MAPGHHGEPRTGAIADQRPQGPAVLSAWFGAGQTGHAMICFLAEHLFGSVLLLSPTRGHGPLLQLRRPLRCRALGGQQDGAGPMGKEAAQVPITTFADASQVPPATRRRFPRREVQPARKLPSASERVDTGTGRPYSRSRPRTTLDPRGPYGLPADPSLGNAGPSSARSRTLP